MNLLNRVVIAAMPAVPKMLVGRVASRYIAGRTIEEALAVVKELNAAGAMATVDVLGEHTTVAEEAVKATGEYLALIDAIHQRGLNANVSLKPTHIGLKLGYEHCRDLVEQIVARAEMAGNFVRIDMEDRSCTDDTLRLYYDLRRRHTSVGVVIQAYLRRTVRDMERLMEMRANIRLCKGIYNEPRRDAFKNRAVIIRNYAYILEHLLRAGCYVGIATHCEETIWHAQRIIRDQKLTRDQYEFQMLLGVEPELRSILLDQGHRVRVYVPYGEDWYPYSTRRLKENPAVAGYVIRDFLGLHSQNER